MKDSINEILSKFAVELNYDDIPKEVLVHLKDILLDSYGCGLYGSSTPWMKIYKNVLNNLSDRKDATIWGTNKETSVFYSMMINGAAINSFELDDTHTDGIIHVSTGVLGCITAFAEMIGNVSGKDFLTAAALAYEISCRVAASVGTEIAHQGFNNTGSCCPFGSTVGIGKMLNLNCDQMMNAMGIAGNWSSGLQAVQFASMAKRIVPSKSSEGAILGCLLAKEGFTGIEDVFENKFGGFYNCFSDDIYDKDRIIGQLSDRWEILEIGLKAYSTCRSKHTTIDALRRFSIENPGVTPDQINKITVHTTSITHKYSVDADAITSVVAAQLSHPYVCAVTLLEGNAFIDQFTEEKIRDEKILELANKVEVVPDPEIEKLPRSLRYTVKIDLHLVNGKKFHIEEVYPKGHPRNPFTEEELLYKFKRLAGKVFNDEQHLNRIIKAVRGIEDLDNISSLVHMLKKNSQ